MTATFTPSHTPPAQQQPPTATQPPQQVPPTATPPAQQQPPTATQAPPQQPTVTFTPSIRQRRHRRFPGSTVDPRFNNPLDIPLDTTASVTEFSVVSRWGHRRPGALQCNRMNPNRHFWRAGEAHTGGELFGTNTDQVQFFTNGQTFTCGQTIVDREVTFDPKHRQRGDYRRRVALARMVGADRYGHAGELSSKQ
ncbi:MAG: hypothetical protein H6671_06385 [Anaerolineaceae bacterium]|nr:hypothetical protein [Anaerolineaceae bacterium]